MATINTASKQAELVQFILLPRFNMATLTTMIEPMRIANYLSTHALYHWQFLSRHGGAVQASNDIVIAYDELASDKIVSGKSPASTAGRGQMKIRRQIGRERPMPHPQ